MMVSFKAKKKKKKRKFPMSVHIRLIIQGT